MIWDKTESRWNIKHLNISKDKVIVSHKSGAPGSLHPILYFGWCKNLKTKISCLCTFNFMKKAWLYYFLFLSTVYKKDNQQRFEVCMCVRFGVWTDEVYCALVCDVWGIRICCWKLLALVHCCVTNTLCRKSNFCIPRKGIVWPHSQFLHSCVCERFIYIPRIGSHIWLQQNRQTDPRKYKSPTDIWV